MDRDRHRCDTGGSLKARADPIPANDVVLRPGFLVQDPLGRRGVLCSREQPPERAWIAEHVKAEEILALEAPEWWGVIPFGGGFLLWPGALLEGLRPAAYEDFLAAADGANPAGREKLALLFPQYVDRLLRPEAHEDGRS